MCVMKVVQDDVRDEMTWGIVAVDERYSVTGDGLRVLGVSAADEGDYTCRAEVEADGRYNERRIHVEVHGKSKARLTARVDMWPVSITRQHGPCWLVMETGHTSTRAVNSGSGNQA